MPVTAQAWAAGESAPTTSTCSPAPPARARRVFARDEAMLVAQCEELTFGQAVKTVQYWCQRADAELDRDGPPPAKPTTLRLHTGIDGTVNGDFHLDPIAGATVTEALRRIERELYRQDQRDGVVRTTAERMAAALVEMATRAHTAPANGRRPEPLLCILAGEATVEHLCELASGVVIQPDLIVPHLARSQVQTFIFDGADRVIAASPQRTFRGRCAAPSRCATATASTLPAATPRSPTATSTTGSPTARAGSPPKRTGNLECEPHNRKSDLHGREPADVIAAARQRRELEHVARQRLDALIADQANRPPPHAA